MNINRITQRSHIGRMILQAQLDQRRCYQCGDNHHQHQR
jgi:hypothetical protein